AADLGDAREHGLERAALLQLRDHEIAHLLPVGVAHPLVDPRVADDRELAILDAEIDQDAVPVGGEMHAEMGEDLVGAAERVRALTGPSVDATLEVDPDLRGGRRLRPPDRLGDRLEVSLAEQPLRPARMTRGMLVRGHHQSPLAPPPPKPPPPPENPPPPP